MTNTYLWLQKYKMNWFMKEVFLFFQIKQVILQHILKVNKLVKDRRITIRIVLIVQMI